MKLKQGSTIFLRGVIVLIGLGVLAVCLFFLPIGLRSDATGLYQPIILGLYAAAIPFFYALHQAVRLLGNIDKNQAFSNSSIKALKLIKYCALTICGLFTAGSPCIYYAADKDDAPGVMAVGLIIIFASFVVATFTGVLQKLIENAVNIKSENDLTV